MKFNQYLIKTIIILLFDKMTTIPQDVQIQYNKLKTEYSEIFKRYLELEEERRENSLVLTNVEPLKGDRKCWKVLGGVLV